MTTHDPAHDNKAHIQATALKDVIQIQSVHANVSQNLIITTEDKVRLCLNDTLKTLGLRQAWQTPAGIVLTLAVTLVTASFQDKFGLSQDMWHAVFFTSAIGCIIWLAATLFRLPKSRSVDDVIVQLKAGTAFPATAGQEVGTNRLQETGM